MRESDASSPSSPARHESGPGLEVELGSQVKHETERLTWATPEALALGSASRSSSPSPSEVSYDGKEDHDQSPSHSSDSEPDIHSLDEDDEVGYILCQIRRPAR